MTSECLQKARNFEEEHMKRIHPDERPCYHMTGGVGWINDPNGFSLYKGEYHLFYQYHPYSNEWGPMHWGHVKSRDLIAWERLPVVMAPDEDYDKDGCFSGSALELADGKHLIMYTAVQQVAKDDGTTEQFQTQCMALGDGVNYTKYSGNPVISKDQLPKGGLIADFRDPKIWQEEDGTFYSVIVDMLEDGNGAALLYKSTDAFHWEYCAMLDSSDGKLGNMWECPDFFELGQKQLLLVSPMAMKPDGNEFHVGHGTAAIIGAYDKKTYTFTREYVHAIDSGIDFYAPQTTVTPDGRRVMIGWMQAWTNSKFVPEGVKYFGQLSVPRELTMRGGRLIQNPVRELENYRGELAAYTDVPVSKEVSLKGVSGRVLDMTVHIHMDESPAAADTSEGKQSFNSFMIKLACGGEYYTSLCYTPGTSTLRMDRSHSGYLYDIVHSRDIKVTPRDGELKLRILLDRYSMEVFINDGEQAASLTLYTPQSADGITFCAEGAARISVEKYELRFPF